MTSPQPLAFLVVDDSATIRKMIMSALRPLKPMFREANTGLEALEQMTLHHYDAILLDLNMPDMHGLDFLQFIRGHKVFGRIPVIVITTRTDEQMRATVLAAGADRYITKPFAPQILLEAITELLPLSES